MEHQFGKHVRVICDLNIGDKINIIGFGRPLNDKQVYTITDIKFKPSCESSYLFKIDEYASYLDSNWATLTPED